jgi:hypothetical protein
LAEALAAARAGDWAGAERVCDQWDEIDAANRKPPPTPLQAALWYVSLGLKVFPLQPERKIPFPGSHGVKDATSDAALVRRWWAVAPTANVAVATGHLVDVIDVDGLTGVLSLDRGVLAGLPPTVGRVKTPRPGGCHLWIEAMGSPCRAGIVPGIDTRGLGGYVVAPPSHVTTSDYNGFYRWDEALTLPRGGDAGLR